ncbi:Bro-N domain-containing protein [Bodo saltans virus]|uniref:Bro-N domain-containing protein n=1 Tax=Bodo saltans virus TaxID=2024608 RepID=A0A2H4UU07_9VIRU|nr:Bro-N domain-containing protein [Bodo saltans virus]ATZ80420.1 Bro-N domain-containing protein [Bodo saltans virus]
MEKKTISPDEKTIKLKGKAIKFALNLFEFCGKSFAYYRVDDAFYFRAKDAAEFLGYINPLKAIRTHVPEKYRKTLNEILNLQGVTETVTPCKFNENELNTIFISEAGLYRLIFGSKKEEADEFQQFVFDELLPKLRKNGYYSLSDDIVKDTSASISYFDMRNISTFKNVPVIYIGAVGVYQGQLLYKFGYTSNIEERLQQHKKTFGNQFLMLLVCKTYNNIHIESLIKSYIKLQNMQQIININGANQTELFTTNNITNVQLYVYDLIIKNPTDEHLNQFNGETLLIEKEKTEQLRIQLEMMKMSKGISNPIEIAAVVPIIATTTEPICVVKRFIKECTETSDIHTHTPDIYGAFVEWFKQIYPDTKIPSNKEFINKLKKYKTVERFYYNQKQSFGVKNFKICTP